MSIRFYLSLGMAFLFATANAQQLDDEVKRSVWFKPELIENHDEICEGALTAIRERFFSIDSMASLTDPYSRDQIGVLAPIRTQDLETESFSNPNPPNERLAGVVIVNQIVEVDGKRVYLYFGRTPGCGGACEGSYVAAGSAPHQDFDTSRFGVVNDKTKAITSGRLTSFAEKDRYYSIQSGDGTIEIERLTSEPKWSAACKVRIKPVDFARADASVRRVKAAIEEVEKSLRPILGRDSDCGSSHALSRATNGMQEALAEIPYRPWAASSSTRHGSAAYMQQLGNWSLTGPSQYEALLRHRAQLGVAISALSDMLRQQYKWTPTQSMDAADSALSTAIGAGFWFGQNDLLPNRAEQTLRAAVLSGQPRPNILDAPIREQASDPKFAYFEYADDLLGTLVDDPESIRVLLDRGANPNGVNAFGKTSLMHAAHRNQLESARLLLSNGADPNMKTVRPNDRCFYRLETSNVTALHYATRYASADFVRLLVKYGAATNVLATRSYWPEGPSSGEPLAWLNHYARTYGKEYNSNIRAEDLADLRELLRVPDEKDLAASARRLTLEAQRQYRRGDVASAYRSLRGAMQTGLASLQTFSDVSLIANKAGFADEALEATNKLAQSGDAGMAAAGWLNRGLICNQYNYRYHLFNGNYYCREGLLYPFLRSWVLKNSSGAREKIRSFFDVSTEVCLSPSQPKQKFYAVYSYGEDVKSADRSSSGKQKIYVYHPPQDSIDPRSMTWTDWVHAENGRKERTNIPVVVSRYHMSDFAITVLESDAQIPQGNDRCGFFSNLSSAN